MSIFFQDIDDSIGFGIQTCNVSDVAIFSSTGYDARIRLFTTNNDTPGLENLDVGSAFGTSNYELGKQNEIYIGHITGQSNVQKVIVVRGSNVGINTLYPSAALQVTGPESGYGDAFLVTVPNNVNQPTFRIDNTGLVGVGTDPVPGKTMTVKGALQVDSLTIGGSVSFGNSALITAAGMVSGSGNGGNNYLLFGNNSFSNITNIELQPNGSLVTDTITPLTQPNNTISFNTGNLSNISNLYLNSKSSIYVDTIIGTTNYNVNIPLIYSSNITTSNIVTNNLSANTLLTNLNVNNYSLSNVNLLDVATITSHNNSEINFANNKLNNINTADINSISINSLASLTPSTAINANNTKITAVGDLTLNPYSSLNTNSINNTGTQNYINFNNTSLTNISNLTINGVFNIPGGVTITNQTVMNSEKLSITNAGTDTALVVNQTGVNKNYQVAKFLDVNNVVFMVKSGGQTLIGNIGNSLNADAFAQSSTLPKAQLYITNPLNGSVAPQDTVFIQQSTPGRNILTLQGTSPLASNSIFYTSSGKLGMGLVTITTEPNARIQVAQQAGDTTDYLRMTSTGAANSSTNAFVITSTGRVGIRTDPLHNVYNSSTAALIVAGTIQADNLILGNSGAGSTNLLTAYGMTPPSGITYLNFGGTNMSNINTINPNNIQTTSLGTAAVPAYAFSEKVSPNNAGIFGPSANSFAIATAGTERLRIDQNGNVGIGLANPQYNLDIGSGRVGAGSFTGSGSNLTYLNASELAYGIVPLAQLPIASTSTQGITQLINSTSCNSITLAATTNSIFLTNTNLNLKIINASDASSNYTNVKIATSLMMSSNYTDVKGDSALIASSNYTDVKVAAASFTSSNYTDVKVAAASFASSNYTDLKVANVSLVSYNDTDVKVAAASLASSNYTNVKVAAASLVSSNYTNVQVASASYSSSNYTDIKVATASSSSSNYTNVQVATASYASSNYTNVQVAATSSASSNYTNLQVAATLYASSNYTNIQVANASYASSNYTNVQIAAVSYASSNYTDVKVTAASYASSNYTDVKIKSSSDASSNYTDSQINTRVSKSGDTISGNLTVTGNISGNGSLLTNLQTSQLIGTISTNNLPIATLTQSGIVQLNNSLFSTDLNTAATANAVNLVYNQVSNRILNTGDTMRGNLDIFGKLKIDPLNTLTGVQGSSLSIAGGVTIGSSYNTSIIPDGSLVASGFVGIGTSSPQYELDVFGTLRVTGTTIFNSYVVFDDVVINSIQASKLNTVNFTGINTSNINNINANNIYVTKISSGSATSCNINGSIDITDCTLSNIKNVNSSSITTPLINSPTNQVSFGYNKILDVESLIVRSNITVTLTGTNTYTNLPTNLVTLDSSTGRILDQYISANIARLMSDGTLNPAMIPVQQLPRSTLLRTTDKVGIGNRFPKQKLHVSNGNIALTGGRLGIGTETTPLGALYINDENSGVPSMRIDNNGSFDSVRINGSNNSPLFYITANSNVGINTSTPQYKLDVNGTSRTLELITNKISSVNGTIDCGLSSLSNIFNLYVRNVNVSSAMNLPSINTTSINTTSINTNTISTSTNTNIQVINGMHITGYDTELYTTPSSNFGPLIPGTSNRIGLRVDNNIITNALLTISDKRVKNNIIVSDSNVDLNNVLNIPVHKYNLIDKPDSTIIGFIAQEIEEIVPNAINTITNAIPSIMKMCKLKSRSIIYYSGNKCEDVNLGINSQIKLIHVGGKETINTVSNIYYIDNNVEIHLTEPIDELYTLDSSDSSDNKSNIFVYGRVVNDFKLINNERLLPLVFNSIKSLYNTITNQEVVINNILERLEALERL